jgi:hypothetical protein
MEASSSSSASSAPAAAAGDSSGATGGEQDDPWTRGGAALLPGRHITLVASTQREQLPGRPSAFRVRIPKLDAYFTGTGARLANRYKEMDIQ